jgi:hypothetical protein
MTVSALCPSTRDITLKHYTLSQFSLFTPVQRRAIIQFLRFVAEHADSVQRPDAQKALERHWTEEVAANGFDTTLLLIPE